MYGNWSPFFLSLILLAPVAVGQGPDGSLSPAGRGEVVEAAAAKIAERYVFPGVAEAIAAELRGRLAAGGYDDVATAGDLAGRLTAELRLHDPHFVVSWSPPASGVEPPGSHSPAAAAQWAEYARRQNHGFARVERLAGNVGYLDLRFFDDVARARDTALAAMRLLTNSDAVIVDVRQNGGGEPGMVQLLLSHFLAGGVHYNSFAWRGAEEREEFRTLEELPNPRMLDVPLYVLTSRRSGSAAEGFTYALQAFGRAIVVGQASAGAANPGEGFDLGRGFGIFISTGAPINAVTGTNWGGAGVQPDVAVPADRALTTAHLAAVERLLAKAGPGDRLELEWAAEELRVAGEPVVLEPAELAAYAGRYGDRVVRLADGALTYQRADRPAARMIPLGGDRFAVAGKDGFRSHFERGATGKIERLVDSWSDGHVEANRREE